MERQAYPSDLSDAQWLLLEPLLPPAKPGGRPRTVNVREIVNGIFYVLRTGCAWRYLPHEFPRRQTVYHYFRAWRLDGTWQRVNDTLRSQTRLAAGRQESPSAAVLDSQSTKTTEKGGLGAMMPARR